MIAAIVLVGCMVSLSGCGQRGSLYLPAASPGTQRATLPQTLLPNSNPAATAPAAAASSPSPSETAK